MSRASTGGSPAHHVHMASAKSSTARIAACPGASADSCSALRYRLGRCLQAAPARRAGAESWSLSTAGGEVVTPKCPLISQGCQSVRRRLEPPIPAL